MTTRISGLWPMVPGGLRIAGWGSWPAIGSISSFTVGAIGTFTDGETLTVSSQFGDEVFEFDVLGNGVTPGRTAINLSTWTTADQIAAAIYVALLASGWIAVAVGATVYVMAATPEDSRAWNTTSTNAGITASLVVQPRVPTFLISVLNANRAFISHAPTVDDESTLAFVVAPRRWGLSRAVFMHGVNLLPTTVVVG